MMDVPILKLFPIFADAALKAQFVATLSAESVRDRLTMLSGIAEEVGRKFLGDMRNVPPWEPERSVDVADAYAPFLEPLDEVARKNAAEMLHLLPAEESALLLRDELMSRALLAAARFAPEIDGAGVRMILQAKRWSVVDVIAARKDLAGTLSTLVPDLIRQSWESAQIAQSLEGRIGALDRIGSLVAYGTLPPELRRTLLARLSSFPVLQSEWLKVGESEESSEAPSWSPEEDEEEMEVGGESDPVVESARGREARAIVRILVMDPQTPEISLRAASPWIMSAAAGFWADRAAEHPSATPMLWHRLLDEAPIALLASRVGAARRVYEDKGVRERILSLPARLEREENNSLHPFFWANLCTGAPDEFFATWWHNLRQADGVMALLLLLYHRLDAAHLLSSKEMDLLLSSTEVRRELKNQESRLASMPLTLPARQMLEGLRNRADELHSREEE